MSAYRDLSPADLDQVRAACGARALHGLQAVTAGIENSNWFIELEFVQRRQAAVLTLAESAGVAQLDFVIALTDRLAAAGLPVPAALSLTDGARRFVLHGRPAILVPRLAGRHAVVATPAQCAAAGRMLAQLHHAAQELATPSVLPPDAQWWRTAWPDVAPTLPAGERAALGSALAEADATFHSAHDLPRGVVHGDLFRDNVLFTGDVVSGVLDFFHATHDLLAWDLAIALNDWTMVDGIPDAGRAQALLTAYAALRPLTAGEQAALPALRRAAAARFWLSRCIARATPRDAAVATRKDPDEMRAWWQALSG